MSADLDSLADERLDGIIDDAGWQQLQDAHGEALTQAHQRAARRRQALASLPKPGMPADLRARIAQRIREAPASTGPVPAEDQVSAPAIPPVAVSNSNPADTEAETIPGPGSFWRSGLPLLIAAGILLAVLPIMLHDSTYHPEHDRSMAQDDLAGVESAAMEQVGLAKLADDYQSNTARPEPTDDPAPAPIIEESKFGKERTKTKNNQQSRAVLEFDDTPGRAAEPGLDDGSSDKARRQTAADTGRRLEAVPGFAETEKHRKWGLKSDLPADQTSATPPAVQDRRSYPDPRPAEPETEAKDLKQLKPQSAPATVAAPRKGGGGGQPKAEGNFSEEVTPTAEAPLLALADQSPSQQTPAEELLAKKKRLPQGNTDVKEAERAESTAKPHHRGKQRHLARSLNKIPQPADSGSADTLARKDTLDGTEKSKLEFGASGRTDAKKEAGPSSATTIDDDSLADLVAKANAYRARDNELQQQGALGGRAPKAPSSKVIEQALDAELRAKGLQPLDFKQQVDALALRRGTTAKRATASRARATSDRETQLAVGVFLEDGAEGGGQRLAIRMANTGKEEIPSLNRVPMRLQALDREGKLIWQQSLPVPLQSAMAPGQIVEWHQALSGAFAPPATAQALRLAAGQGVSAPINLLPGNPTVGQPAADAAVREVDAELDSK